MRDSVWIFIGLLVVMSTLNFELGYRAGRCSVGPAATYREALVKCDRALGDALNLSSRAIGEARRCVEQGVRP